MTFSSRRAAPRPRLRALADRLGIVAEYLDQTGRHVRRTSDATREALLAIMGFDAPTEEAADGWLDELEHERRAMIVEPVRVVPRDDRSARSIMVQLPPGVREASVEMTLQEESGHVWRAKQTIERRGTIAFPTRVPYGYHKVSVRVRASAGDWSAEQSLIVVPARCIAPDTVLGAGRRAMGIVANLYALRRERDWGVGDLTTLTQLVEWGAPRGAAFVGVNPLHALFNRGMDISPYSPVSRLFRNPLYIDVEEVPEMAQSADARAMLESRDWADLLRGLRGASHVDYDGAIALKHRILAELHREFRTQAGRGRSERAREYAEFVAAREPEITRFATWMAIAESAGVPDWRTWPEAMQSPESAAVASFREANQERVDFHRWLQFETNRQLHAVAEHARASGMPIGVYQDLAIGTSRGGSDTWSYPDLFLAGAAVGAPPDPYAPDGQNWGLPPIDPRALRRQGYRYWIQLLRRAFEHAGALRIDHVMGLFRMFWVPDGGTGKDGAYVRFPADDLLGILALESVRHDALVVGEDLGTVPREVPPALRRWGVLSSQVLYFERDRSGFRRASRYAELALATANTHDLPTLAGFWTERDIALRAQVGLLPNERAIRAAKRERAGDKRALLRLLKLGSPHAFEERVFLRRFAGSVHDFLCSTPARLVGLSLDDLIGETDPVNVPGVGPDRYPSWRRRTRMSMEEIGWNFEVDDTIRCGDRRGPRR